MTTEPPKIVRVHPGYKIGRDERHLTARQREVMGWLGQGITNGTEIAVQMGLTRQRVNSILRELERKGVLRRTKEAIEIVITRPQQNGEPQ